MNVEHDFVKTINLPVETTYEMYVQLCFELNKEGEAQPVILLDDGNVEVRLNLRSILRLIWSTNVDKAGLLNKETKREQLQIMRSLKKIISEEIKLLQEQKTAKVA